MYSWETERYQIAVYKARGKWVVFVADALASVRNRYTASYFSSRDEAIDYATILRIAERA